MNIQRLSNRLWVYLLLAVFVIVVTVMVAIGSSGPPSYRASSSLLLALEPVVGVDDAVDQLESADTSNAVGTLSRVLSNPDLHLAAMDNVGIDSSESAQYRVSVTSPTDSLMVEVEVTGPGPSAEDLVREIGRQASVLAEGFSPGLALEMRPSTLPTTDGANSVYLLLSVALGCLGALVVIGATVFKRRDDKATNQDFKASLRNWIEGEPVPSQSRFGPRPDPGPTAVVIAGLSTILLIAPRQAIWMLLGAFIALSMLLALRFPQLLAIGLVVMVLFNLSDIGTDFFGLPGTSVPYTLFVIVVLAIRTSILGEDRRSWLGLAIAIGALIALMSISGMTANDQALAFERTVDLVKNGLVAVLMVVLIRNIGDLRRVIWVLILGASFLSLLGIVRNVMGDVPGLLGGFSQVVNEVADEEVVGVRIAGPLGDANFFGQLLVLVFPFALERAFRERSWLARLTAAVATVLIAAAVALTYSRGALIGIVVATVVALAFIRPTLKAVLVALFVSGLVLFMAPSQYIERIGSLGQVLQIGSSAGLEDASLQGRFGEMLVGVEMFHDYPIAGVGPGNYPVRYVEYSSALGLDYRLELRQPHSLPIEVAAELGIVGLAWWTVAAFVLVSGLLRARRFALATGETELQHYIETICVSFAGFAATALFLHLAYSRSLWMLVGIAVAATQLANAPAGRTTSSVGEYQAT